MAEHLTPYDPVFKQRLAEIITRMSYLSDPITASRQAYGEIYQTLVRQATLLAYIDNFRFLAFLCLLCVPTALLFKKVRARGAPTAMH